MRITQSWSFRLFPREIQAVMKTRLIESLPGVLPDSLEIHGDYNVYKDEDDKCNWLWWWSYWMTSGQNVTIARTKIFNRKLLIIAFRKYTHFAKIKYKIIQNDGRVAEFDGSLLLVSISSSSSFVSSSLKIQLILSHHKTSLFPWLWFYISSIWKKLKTLPILQEV